MTTYAVAARSGIAAHYPARLLPLVLLITARWSNDYAVLRLPWAGWGMGSVGLTSLALLALAMALAIFGLRRQLAKGFSLDAVLWTFVAWKLFTGFVFSGFWATRWYFRAPEDLLVWTNVMLIPLTFAVVIWTALRSTAPFLAVGIWLALGAASVSAVYVLEPSMPPNYQTYGIVRMAVYVASLGVLAWFVTAYTRKTIRQRALVLGLLGMAAIFSLAEALVLTFTDIGLRPMWSMQLDWFPPSAAAFADDWGSALILLGAVAFFVRRREQRRLPEGSQPI